MQLLFMHEIRSLTSILSQSQITLSATIYILYDLDPCTKYINILNKMREINLKYKIKYTYIHLFLDIRLGSDIQSLLTQYSSMYFANSDRIWVQVFLIGLNFGFMYRVKRPCLFANVSWQNVHIDYSSRSRPIK